MRVGFIGLGRMGFPMAHNLIKAGHTVVAHNRSRGPVERLAAFGAIPASTPVEAARSMEILQILTGAGHVLVAEAMVLGTKLGIDPQKLFEVLTVSSGQSRALDRSVPEAILPRNFNAVYTVVKRG